MEVIRMPEIDQLKPVPRIRVRTFFILRKVVNEQIYHDALDRLIRHHWRKLGARLATRHEDGRLEYQLPHSFEEKYALFNWTSKQHDGSIARLGLPEATPPEMGITLQPHIETLEPQLSPSEWPLDRTMEPSGAPILYAHISLFSDASCIAVNCPHAVSDQFGLSNIMRAWLGMTRGMEPPPMMGTHNDIFATERSYVDYPRKEVARKGRLRVRRKGEYALAILPVIPDLVLRKKEVKHTLFIPLPLIQSLHQRHKTVLERKYGKDPGISHNDIICAILLKVSIPQVIVLRDGSSSSRSKFSRIYHQTPRTLALSQTINCELSVLLQVFIPFH